MRWLKRNLFLVVGILVALGLLGGAIFYLITNFNLQVENQSKFDAVKAEFEQYQTKAPTPNKENIALATADTKRLESFGGTVRAMFKTPAQPKLDDPAFLSLLLNTISELNRAATNAAVAVPDKYKYTFTAHAAKTKYMSNSVPAAYMQLMEVKGIVQLLLHSKVISIDTIKRAPISLDDAPLSSGDYLDRRIITNQFGIVVPYEVSFRCFSAELASVLNAFAKTEEFFLIKNMVVMGEPPLAQMASTTSGVSEGQVPTAMTPGPAPVPGAARAAKGPARPVPPKTIVDEKPLRVTLQIDLMRGLPVAPAVKPAQPAAQPAQPAPAAQTP